MDLVDIQRLEILKRLSNLEIYTLPYNPENV